MKDISQAIPAPEIETVYQVNTLCSGCQIKKEWLAQQDKGEKILKHGRPREDEDIEAWQKPYKDKKGGQK